MATFKRDDSKIKSFSAGPIVKTGFYPLTITQAFDIKSQDPNKLSEAVQLDCVTDTGQYATIKIWHIKANGEPNDMALDQLNDLQYILGLNTLNSVRGKIKQRDWDARCDVEVNKMVYKDLFGAQIGAVFNMIVNGIKKERLADGSYQDKLVNGKTIPKVEPEFKQFADAETKATAAELKEKVEKPVAVDRYVEILLSDDHIIKQSSNQPNAPQVDPVKMGGATAPGSTNYDDFDDSDIPF